MNWGNFKLERFALVLLALGTGITMFIRVMNSGAPALPLSERKAIVDRDRRFLEAAPPEARAELVRQAPGVSSLVGQTAPVHRLDDGEPGVRNVIGERCYGKACVTVSLQTGCTALANFPTCTAGLQGTIRCATDGSSADGGATTMQCVGGAWTEMGGGGTITTEPLTASAPLVLYDDGGTVNVSFGMAVISDPSRNVAGITAGASGQYTLSGISDVVFEAGDTCSVGFVLNATGGLAATTWRCWPSDTNAIVVEVGCINGAGSCDPLTQNLTYTVICPDGSCY